MVAITTGLVQKWGIEQNAPISHPEGHPTEAHMARLVLFSFLVMFMLSRMTVYLIMARKMPDLYLHFGGNHIHHLNYGIFLLVAVGGFLLFRDPTGRALKISAVAYGIGLALTFDEFGMWVRLDGSTYWQRASLDAVGVLAALLGLLAFAPEAEEVPSPSLVECGFAADSGAAVFRDDDKLFQVCPETAWPFFRTIRGRPTEIKGRPESGMRV